MTSSTHFEFDKLSGETDTATSSSYQEVLRRQAFSMGVYTLPVDAQDHQHPHAADEVYVVMRGAANLWVDGTNHPVKAGSVVSVSRGGDHHFTDITEPLSILVIFAPPDAPEED